MFDIGHSNKKPPDLNNNEHLSAGTSKRPLDNSSDFSVGLTLNNIKQKRTNLFSSKMAKISENMESIEENDLAASSASDSEVSGVVSDYCHSDHEHDQQYNKTGSATTASVKPKTTQATASNTLTQLKTARIDLNSRFTHLTA